MGSICGKRKGVLPKTKFINLKQYLYFFSPQMLLGLLIISSMWILYLGCVFQFNSLTVSFKEVKTQEFLIALSHLGSHSSDLKT